jgi:outer membrane immunogenic protein
MSATIGIRPWRNLPGTILINIAKLATHGRSRMKRWLIAGALAFAAAGQAAAADLPQPPPQAPAVYVPVVAPVYNWGGIYYGINGGYGFGKTTWTDPNNFSGLGSTGNFNTDGFVVGPTLGVNFQNDAFVYGIEGDFDASWLDGKSTSAFCGAVGFGAGAQCETKNTWLGTLRGRIGYAADRVLFYATGGGAFGNVESGIGGSFDKSTKAGWTAGAGVEAAFADNWTARIEYLYVDLGNGSCTSGGNCGVDLVGAAVVPANDTVKFTTSLVRAGIDYKFR